VMSMTGSSRTGKASPVGDSASITTASVTRNHHMVASATHVQTQPTLAFVVQRLDRRPVRPRTFVVLLGEVVRARPVGKRGADRRDVALVSVAPRRGPTRCLSSRRRARRSCVAPTRRRSLRPARRLLSAITENTWSIERPTETRRSRTARLI
jgi:hypothetical protein